MCALFAQLYWVTSAATARYALISPRYKPHVLLAMISSSGCAGVALDIVDLTADSENDLTVDTSESDEENTATTDDRGPKRLKTGSPEGQYKTR